MHIHVENKQKKCEQRETIEKSFPMIKIDESASFVIKINIKTIIQIYPFWRKDKLASAQNIKCKRNYGKLYLSYISTI